MTTIPVKGVVSSDDDAEIWQIFGYSTVSPKDVEDALKTASGGDVTVEINSPGGEIPAGSEIYTALKNYPGKVNVQIVGEADSSASIIAMAGNHIAISPTATMLIHRASGGFSGNSDALQQGLQGLNASDQNIVAVYQQRTGLDAEKIYNMMVNETTLNAKTALEDGFVDEIMFADETKPVTTNTALDINPVAFQNVKSLLNKLKSKEIKDSATESDKQTETAKVNTKTNSKPAINAKLAILLDLK